MVVYSKMCVIYLLNCLFIPTLAAVFLIYCGHMIEVTVADGYKSVTLFCTVEVLAF